MQPNTPLQINDGTVLDPKVVKVMRAIRQVESGGSADPYKAVGDAGAAHGAFQYNEKTGPGWSNLAKQYLGDANAPMDKANQNKVTYMRIKAWKDEGRDPEEIAALWNGASKDPNTGRYIYNNPQYGEKFRAALTGQSYGGNYTPPPPTPQQYKPAEKSGIQSLAGQVDQTPERGLGGFINETGQAFTRTGEGINKAVGADYNNIVSKGIQVGGALAGTVGDITDAALGNLPVVGGAYRTATDLIGGAVQGAMETAPGQKALEWADKHPEAAGNIGAGLNILSVIPFFKSLKAGAKGFSDARTALTASKVEKQAQDEIRNTLTQKKDRVLDRAEKRGLDPIGTLIKNPAYLPDVIEQGGKNIYDAKQAARAVQQSIDAQEKTLQNLFASTIKQNVGVDINKVKDQVFKDILPKGKINVNKAAIERELNRLFGDIISSAGRNYISLSDLNDIKRQVRKGINFDAIDPTGSLTREVRFDVGQSLMTQVEKIAEKAGIKGVRQLNKAMAQDIEAADILEFLDGRPIKAGAEGKPGLISSIASTIPGVEGALKYANSGVPRTPVKRLRDKRPVRESVRTAAGQGVKGLVLSGQLTGEE